MFIYKGFNPESKEKIIKEFEDDYDAISYARENAYQFPKYKVTDSNNDDELIESDKVAQDTEDSIRDNMFPDEGSEDGFDIDDFFDKE